MTEIEVVEDRSIFDAVREKIGLTEDRFTLSARASRRKFDPLFQNPLSYTERRYHLSWDRPNGSPTKRLATPDFIVFFDRVEEGEIGSYRFYDEEGTQRGSIRQLYLPEEVRDKLDQWTDQS